MTLNARTRLVPYEILSAQDQWALGPDATAPPSVIVVRHVDEELKRLVPATR